MEWIKFRTTLLGYSKADVRDYIAKMNEDFSKTLMDNLADQEKKKDALKEQIALLEAQVEEYKKQRNEISDAILDAKKYASFLKEEADKEKLKRELEFSEWDEQQIQKLDDYQKDIAEIRKQLNRFSENMEMDLLKYEEQLEFFKNHCQSRTELKSEEMVPEISEKQEENYQESFILQN